MVSIKLFMYIYDMNNYIRIVNEGGIECCSKLIV